MWLKIRFSSFSHYFCTVYHSFNGNDPLNFDLLSSNIEMLISTNLNSRTTVVDDFKVHNKDCQLCSSDTSTVRGKAKIFAVVSNLCQLVDLLVYIPDRLGDRAHTLDLPSFSNFTSLPPLDSSNHCLMLSPLFFLPRRNAPLALRLYRLG